MFVRACVRGCVRVCVYVCRGGPLFCNIVLSVLTGIEIILLW